MSLILSCFSSAGERFFRDPTFSASSFNLRNVTAKWSSTLGLNAFRDGELTTTPKEVHSTPGHFWDLEMFKTQSVFRWHLPPGPSWTPCAHIEHVYTLFYLAVMLQTLEGEPHISSHCLASGTRFLVPSLLYLSSPCMHLYLSFYGQM